MGAGCSGDYLQPENVSQRYTSRSDGASSLPSHGVGSMESSRGGPVRATPLSNPGRKAMYAAPNSSGGNSGHNSGGPPALDKPNSGSNSRPGSANRMRRAGSGVRLDPLAKGVASPAQQQQQQPKSAAVPSAPSSVADSRSGALQTTDSTLLEGPSGQVTPATTTKNGQLQPLQRTHSQSQQQLHKQQQQHGGQQHNNNRAAAQVDANLPAAPQAAVPAHSSTRSMSKSQQQQQQQQQPALPAGLPSILATAADPYAAVAQMHAAQQAQQQQLHIQQLQLQQQQLQLQQLMQQQQLYGMKQQQNRYASTQPATNVHGPSAAPPMLPSSRSNSASQRAPSQSHPLSVDVHGGFNGSGGGGGGTVGLSTVGGLGIGPGPSPSHYLSPMSVPQGSQSHSMAFASRSMTPTSSANRASTNHAQHMPPFETAGSAAAAAAMHFQMQQAQQTGSSSGTQSTAALYSHAQQLPPPSSLPTPGNGSSSTSRSPLPPSAIAVSTHMIYHDNNPEYDAYKKQWAAENARETALKRERSKASGHGRTFSRSLLTTPDRSAAASPTFHSSLSPHGAAAGGAAGGGGQRFFPGTHIPPHMLRSLASGAASPLSPGSPPALQGSPPAFPFAPGGLGVTLLPEDVGSPDALEPLSPFDIAEGDQVIGSGYLVGERTALAMLVETRSPTSLCVSPVPGFRVMSISPTPFELLQASPAHSGLGLGGTGPRARLRVQNGAGGALSPSGTMTPGLIISPRAAISGSPLVLGGVPSPGGPGPGGTGAGPGGGGGGGSVSGSIDEQLQARQARLILQQQIALAQQAQALAQAQAQVQAHALPHTVGPLPAPSPSPPPPPVTPPAPSSHTHSHTHTALADAPHFHAAQLQQLQQQLAAQLSATTQAQQAHARKQQGQGHGHHPSLVPAYAHVAAGAAAQQTPRTHTQGVTPMAAQTLPAAAALLKTQPPMVQA